MRLWKHFMHSLLLIFPCFDIFLDFSYATACFSTLFTVKLNVCVLVLRLEVLGDVKPLK